MTKSHKNKFFKTKSDAKSVVHPHDLATNIVIKSQLHAELKKRTQLQSSAATENKETDLKTQQQPCLSVLHLNRLVGKEGTLQEKIERFIKEKASKEDDLVYDERFKEIALEALKCEQENEAKGAFSYYHAVRHTVGVIYDLFTTIDSFMQMDPGRTGVLKSRLLETSFKEIDSINRLLNYFERDTSQRRDHSRDFREMCLSVNTFLFGNHDTAGEASFEFFLRNMSVERELRTSPFAEQGVISILLKNVGLEAAELKEVLNELNELAKLTEKCGGRLYQIHIHKDLIDQLLYPSLAYGEVLTIADEKNKEQSMPTMQKLINSARENTLNDDVMFKLQARLFLQPNLINDPEKIKTDCYLHHPLSPKEMANYTSRLNNVAHIITSKMLATHAAKRVLSSKKPLDSTFQILLNSFEKTNDVFNPRLLLQEILKHQDPDRLSLFIQSWPQYVDMNILKNILFPENKSVSTSHLAQNLSSLITIRHTELFNFMLLLIKQNKIENVLQNGDQFIEILFQLTPSQRSNLILQLGNQIADVIQNSQQFEMILSMLNSPEECHIFANNIRDKLNQFITNGSQLTTLLKRIPQSTHFSFLEDSKLNIVNLIGSYNSLEECLQVIPQDLRFYLINRLPSAPEFIDYNFYTVFKMLNEMDQEKFFKYFINDKNSFQFYVLRLNSTEGKSTNPLIDFLSKEKANFYNFSLNNLDDLSGILARLTGIERKPFKDKNDFAALKEFISTYIAADNPKKYSADSLLNIFINLINPELFQKILSEHENQEAFLKIIPVHCVSHVLFKLGKETSPSLIAERKS